MATYTVAIRERGKSLSRRWLYVSENLSVQDTTLRCKPLTRQQADIVKRTIIDTAAKAGRPVECRIVRLSYPLSA